MVSWWDATINPAILWLYMSIWSWIVDSQKLVSITGCGWSMFPRWFNLRSLGKYPCHWSICIVFGDWVAIDLATGTGHVSMCQLSSSSAAHHGHYANSCAWCHCMFHPCVKCPMLNLTTRCLLAEGTSFIVHAKVLLSMHLRSCGVHFHLFFQYSMAKGPFICWCRASFSCFTTQHPPHLQCHSSNGILKVVSPWLVSWRASLASWSASMLSQASLERTIGVPVSWCPLTWIIGVCILRDCQMWHATLSRLECGSDGSTLCSDKIREMTNLPLHASVTFLALSHSFMK